jgi:hypothetical protein
MVVLPPLTATYPLPAAYAADLPRGAGEVTNSGRRKQPITTKFADFHQQALKAVLNRLPT